MTARFWPLVCLALSACVYEIEDEEVACVGPENASSCLPIIQSGNDRGGYFRPDGTRARMDECHAANWTSVEGPFPAGKFKCCFVVRGKSEKVIGNCQD